MVDASGTLFCWVCAWSFCGEGFEMKQEQREKLFHILGMIEGLTWGVEDNAINEGFCGVVEDLAKLLKEDKQDENV